MGKSRWRAWGSQGAGDRERQPRCCATEANGGAVVLCATLACLSPSCDREEATPGSDAGSPQAAVGGDAPVDTSQAPRRLYLPDSGDSRLGGPATPRPSAPPSTQPERHCPPEMVLVAERFCIDRYEGSLVDASSGQRLSAYYPPSPALARKFFARWSRAAATEVPLHPAPDLPQPSRWQLEHRSTPRAISRRGVVPNGYVSGRIARAACENAGKRLCGEQEWELACRGEGDEPFPYGAEYRQGSCNIFRPIHPSAWLHGDASRFHDDPRLNLVDDRGDPLLRPTGATASCRSPWGDDGVYDMVGNLDEWVADEGGVFRGGFYARANRDGCTARISAHPTEYWDYSLGIRCCRSAHLP